MKKNEKNSSIGYFFKQGYIDLFCTIKDSWKKNKNKIVIAADNLIKSISYSNSIYIKFCMILFNVAHIISIVLFGTLFTALFSLIHIIIIAILMLLVYIGYLIVGGLDLTFRTIKGISTNCYNPNCQKKFSLPIYLCPNCSSKHYFLYPNKYGIMKHKCKCGKKLPTTFFNGRQKLRCLCPHCEAEAINGINKSILIPVIGGTNAGKTCFINMAISEIEKKAKNLNLEFDYLYVQGDERKKNMERFSNGSLPEKTNDRTFKYYNFYLFPKHEKVKNLISICDIAGETFTSQNEINSQQGYRFADSLIVIIDPLSIQEYKREVEKKYNINDYSNSTHEISDIMGVIINTLEGLLHKKSKNSFNMNLCIVFSKCDIPGLNELIGDEAVKKYSNENKNINMLEAINIACEKFLKNYGESNFYNEIKAKFKEVQFFASSALGKNLSQSDKDLNPKNVAEPLLWVIDKEYSSIDLQSIWGKKL